jgi:hypothetical protein
MQEFATTIVHLAHCTHVILPEHLISEEEEACEFNRISE